MAVPFMVIKMVHDLKQQHIKYDINYMIKLIGDDIIIGLNPWIVNDFLNGLIITTNNHIHYCRCDENSIVPIAVYFKMYTNEFKSTMDTYYGCCVMF